MAYCHTQDPFGFESEADIPKPKQQPSGNGAHHTAFTQTFVSGHEYSDFTFDVAVTRRNTAHPDVTHTIKLTDVKAEEAAHIVFHSKELSKTKDKETYSDHFKSQISVVNNRTLESKEVAAKRKKDLEEEAEEAKIIERHEHRKQAKLVSGLSNEQLMKLLAARQAAEVEAEKGQEPGSFSAAAAAAVGMFTTPMTNANNKRLREN